MRSKLVKNFILFFGFGFFILDSLLYNLNDILILNLAVIINIYLMIICSKQKNIFFFFLFSIFYLIYQYPYYYDGIYTAGYRDFNAEVYYSITLRIHYLFLLVLLLIVKPIKKPFSLKDKIELKKNPLIFWAIQVMVLLIPFLGSRGSGLGGMALFEYGIILILLSYKFSKRIKAKKPHSGPDIRLLLSR